MADTDNVQGVTSSEGTSSVTERTFTQADVDRIVMDRLAKERAKQPNDDELHAYREWKKTQKTEAQKQAERDAELASAKSELTQLKAEQASTKAGAKAEFVEFVAVKVRSMDGDFAQNLEKYKKENPQYFGETVIKKTATSPNLSGGKATTETTNDYMNNLLRSRGK